MITYRIKSTKLFNKTIEKMWLLNNWTKPSVLELFFYPETKFAEYQSEHKKKSVRF